MKILTVVGARPQFIKAAVFSRAIGEINSEDNKIDEIIINTDQHFDPEMSDIFFDQLKIPVPKYNLDAGKKSHAQMTALIMTDLEKIVINEAPDAVLVYGDTNSTLAAVISASKMHVPIIHVEAGLRSNNLLMPEEINRIVSDRLSTYLFCPSQTASNNLQEEGYPNPIQDGKKMQQIHNVGDVMFDLYKIMEPNFILNNKHYKSLGRPFAVLTIHRQESTFSKETVENLFAQIKLLLNNKINIIWPIHPRMKKIMEEFDIPMNHEFLNVIEPLGYLEMQGLLKSADFVLTDSGGLQKECFFAKTPCITLRAETEWTETTKFGHNRLYIPNSKVSLLNIAEDIFNENIVFSDDFMPYGNGNSCKEIINILLREFG